MSKVKKTFKKIDNRVKLLLTGALLLMTIIVGKSIMYAGVPTVNVITTPEGNSLGVVTRTDKAQSTPTPRKETVRGTCECIKVDVSNSEKKVEYVNYLKCSYVRRIPSRRTIVTLFKRCATSCSSNLYNATPGSSTYTANCR